MSALPVSPFSVTSLQVIGLRLAFTPFVNRLLDIELASAGIARTNLRTTVFDNVGDGGVDAILYDSLKTDWLVAGDSAWQFKQGDLEPAKCRKELEGAKFVHDILRAGGSYRLVLGAGLNAQQIKRRVDALVAEAQSLGLPHDRHLFDVFDADLLARWASEHTSLAVDHILGGPGSVAETFDAWQKSNRHRSEYVSDTTRDALKQEIDTFLRSSESPDFRIDGQSGVGKTRTTMEAFRDHPFKSLVAHVSDAASLDNTYLSYLFNKVRTAIVVVDECTGRQHEKLAEQLPTGTLVKLITIGPRDLGTIMDAPVIDLPIMAEDDLVKLLDVNSLLWPESRRFVAAYSAGNIRMALWLAKEVTRRTASSAGELIDENAIKSVLKGGLPEGNDFLAAAALALLTRVGWEGDLAGEAQVLAAALQVDFGALQRAARHLERNGLLARQGRYRRVEPQPIAAFLAAEAWKEFGDRITSVLLPGLDDEQALNLFQRAAEIGEFAPAKSAIYSLLRGEGPFSSLSALYEAGRSRLLSAMAVVAPRDLLEHLEQLVDAASDEELTSYGGGLRRSLVNALQKLVWHSRSFADTADVLLRLATCENERYSNNATGAWLSLFAVMLPATSAGPVLRAKYLLNKAETGTPGVKLLAAQAASKALGSPHQSIMVAGELQSGVVVEERGTPKTYGEVWAYQKSMIDILSRLSGDASPEISSASIDGMLHCLHPVLDTQPVLEALLDALLGSSEPSVLPRLRASYEDLRSLFERVSLDEQDHRTEGIAYVASRLPVPSLEEEITLLADVKRWDYQDGELDAKLRSTIALDQTAAVALMLDVLQERAIGTAWEFGRALAATDVDVTQGPVAQALLKLNTAALIGALWWQHNERSQADAFDVFLDSGPGLNLAPLERLGVTVRGPVTPVGSQRLETLLQEVRPLFGGRTVFGWLRNLSEAAQRRILSDWLSRLEDQQDYNAVVDAVNMMLYDTPETPTDLLPQIEELILLRARYPDVAQEAWDWARLAERVASNGNQQLLETMLDQIQAATIDAWDASEDQMLLRRLTEQDPVAAWPMFVDRIADGQWRIMFSCRGWLTDAVPLNVIQQWISGDSERAVIVADLTRVEAPGIRVLVAFLTTEFAGNERVEGALNSRFISGGWSGPESQRLAGQMAQLDGWLKDKQLSKGSRAWVMRLRGYLRESKEAAELREAERGY